VTSSEPPRGSFMRRLRRAFRRFGGPAVAISEEVWAPPKHHARIVTEERRLLAEPSPAPGDPPSPPHP
jgi:hypothetical protein